MNETCTVTIADIYGAEWLSANREELDRKWEWSFGVEHTPCQFANAASDDIIPVNGTPPTGPRIILHRRKPKPPTLREVYGVDEVTITRGMEWTGEWAVMDGRDPYQAATIDTPHRYRLILRERPKKVWFKCEAEPRVPRNGDWFYSYGAWQFANTTGDAVYLCATRHEEIDSTVQVVTQADIDKVGGR